MTSSTGHDHAPRRRLWMWVWILALTVVAVTAVRVFADGDTAAEPGRSVADSGDDGAVVGDDDGCTRWVSPTGDDGAAGTRGQPWATLEHAARAVPDDGCTVWFTEGVYRGYNNMTRRFGTMTTFRSVEPYSAVLEDAGTVVDIDGGRNIALIGFELRHTGPSTPSSDYVAIVDRREDTWSEDIVFQDNIFHDSFGDDLLKLHNGVRGAAVVGNLFYNQGPNEQHIDVNSVIDVEVRDNIFFNDYAHSGWEPDPPAKHFIIVKDSNGDDDGLEGARNVKIRRNVFLNWDGGIETFVKVGNDGMPYHEARDVLVENNLLLGNSEVVADAAFGVRGARDVTFNNNTVVGDLPANSFAYRIHLKDENPRNEDITFTNNVWSDPTGTMGSDGEGSANEFSDGDGDEVEDLRNDTNLYWNGGDEVPEGKVASPERDDPNAVIEDPALPNDHEDIVVPVWDGDGFATGSAAIEEEFVRLVEAFGAPSQDSPVVDAADPDTAARDDILGHVRDDADLGAYEVGGRS